MLIQNTKLFISQSCLLVQPFVNLAMPCLFCVILFTVLHLRSKLGQIILTGSGRMHQTLCLFLNVIKSHCVIDLKNHNHTWLECLWYECFYEVFMKCWWNIRGSLYIMQSIFELFSDPFPLCDHLGGPPSPSIRNEWNTVIILGDSTL